MSPPPQGEATADDVEAAQAATRAGEAQRLSQLRDGSISDATWRAYLSAWTTWATWASAHQRPVLPADPHDLGVWASESIDPTAGQGPGSISISTLTKRMAAVAFIHRRAGHLSPLSDPALSSVLKGLRRTMAQAPSPAGTGQAPALLTCDIETILNAMDHSAPTFGRSLKEIRDRALLLLAFTSAMRASELARLEVADLEPDESGLIVRIRSSKTDQEGAGAFLAIPWARRRHLCPVRAMDAWLGGLRRQLHAQDPTFTTAADLDVDWSTHAYTARGPQAQREHLGQRRTLVTDVPGAVLRALLHNGRVGSTMVPDPHQARMAPLAISKVITARARQGGLTARDGGRFFTAHSTRAGFATQAGANGVPERDIMAHGRWKSLAVARGYIRRGDLFDEGTNAAGQLGL